MVLLGPRREEKPVARKVGVERRALGSAAGRGGQKCGGKAAAAQQQSGTGRSGSVAGRASAPASAPTRAAVLQQPADRQIQRGSRPVQHGRDKDNAAFTAARRSQSDDVGALAALLAAAKGGQPTRDDVLASLAELLGAPQRGFENQAPSLLAAVRGQQGLPAAMQQQQEPHQDQQQGLPSEECAPAACSHGGPTDFSRRNMARLGGEGVAGIFAGSSAEPVLRRGGAADTGYMSALHSLKPGLSDQQATRQAAQREQLKRDLEEQMRLKREAEAARKAELAALEEREEAQLRAYWAAQARAAQGETQHAGPHGGAGNRQAADGAGRLAGQQGSTTWQQKQQDTQSNRERKAAGHKPPAAAPQQGPQSYSPPGGARRGEALLQPGITVFLPPDKEAERRGALRARAASESQLEEAEAGYDSQEQPVAPDGHRSGQHKPSTPSSAAALQQALLQQAMAGGLLAAQQQQQQAQALLAPWLAASNPALAAAAGLQALYPALPQLLLPLPGTAVSAAPSAVPASAPSSSTEPQVAAMLRGLAAEQQQMREQLAVQLEAVTRLAGDASAARSERDRARQDLERVQRLLAERQQAGSHNSAGPAAFGSSGDEDMLSVTTHVLPLGMGIPSRLGTPAGKGAQPQHELHNPSHTALPVPARHWQQAPEPRQALQQFRRGGAPSKASGRAVGPAASGRADQIGALGSSSWSRAAAATKPAGTARGTWRK